LTTDISAFRFDAQPRDLDETSDFLARIPYGLSGKTKLLDALRVALEFPAYFGRNWDALSDCLQDMSWIQSRRHFSCGSAGADDRGSHGLPANPCPSCARVGPNDDHELLVWFPPAVRTKLKTWPAQVEISA
jgi:hypothetical protein